MTTPKTRRVSAAPSDQVAGELDPGEWSAPPLEKGEAHRVSAYIDKIQFRRFEVLHEKHLFPWQTFSDFLRFAVHVGLEKASKAAGDPDLIRDIEGDNQLAVARSILTREKRNQKAYDTNKEALEKLVEEDDDGAGRLARQIIKSAESYPKRWRKRFIKMVEEVYGKQVPDGE